MVKKKLLNTYYMFLLVVLFVIFLGLFSSNSYAMVENNLDYFFNELYNTESFSYLSNTSLLNNIKTKLPSYIDYNYIFVYGQSTDQFLWITLYTSQPIAWDSYSKEIYLNSTEISYRYVLRWGNRTNSLSLLGQTTFQPGLQSTSSSYNIGVVPTATNFVFYQMDFETEITQSYYYIPFETIPVNSITLTATSNHKFGFNDKNQLQVNLSGDWVSSDFSFYVQRFIDGEWQTFSNINDYYILADYDNPYYIFWPNMNYYSVGTYRYMADYGSLGTILYYSNEFQITSSIIDNQGTGTIGNDNININIDTGQTVDNIKDFLGQETDITQEQFSDNFPTIEVDDPTEDFFTWFFEQIQSCFTVSSAQYLTFTLYDKEFRINSDDYILNISIFKNVIGTGSAIFIFYGIFLDIRKEIEKVKEGKFSEIGKDDITASMM